MGRNKIKIERITNERTRLATFNKRKNGLIKKAMELSILCGCDVALIVIGNNKLTQYSSSDMDQLLLRYTDGGFDEPQSEPLTSEDYPKLFGKKNKGNKESPAKKPRVDSPVPQGTHAVVAPALAKTPAVMSSNRQSFDGRASPTTSASGPVVPLVARGPSPTHSGRPVASPPPAGAARHSAPQLAPAYLAAASYAGYPSARTSQFPSQSQSVSSRSASAPSLYSVPSTAPSAVGRVSPSRRGSLASAGSVSPTFEGARPQSPHSSNPPTPPGSGGHYAEDMRRPSGRAFQEQQFSQKLNKKNLSLAIPDASAAGNFPGSSSAGHSRHASYTPGFTGLNVPSAVLPFASGETDMQHSSVLPSPSAFFASDTPGSHGEHGHFLPPSAAWGWLASPRTVDAVPQERFLSRDLNMALQDGTLQQQISLGKTVYALGEKRKADILKV